ncbi:phage tail tape measure protein [Leclercia adecarboxylata]|uniref:phage tail tape measure protein n=1 Tax=Leclercia adecarboxylata TaxID=83655 RepID=UPI00254D917D|nr:phage tail tape measure protein [Leclercia adecarboxylata]
MSDIATISLRVNTAELERGNKALDDFQQTAGGAANKADDLNSVFRAGASDQKKNTQSLKEQQQELQNLLNKISPVNRALDELDNLQESLSKFRKSGLVPDEDYSRYNSVLETTREKLGRVMEAETAEGQERLKQAQETQRATAAQENFLRSITDQAATFRASKADMAEYRAAQMGIAEEAAPVIARLREQELAVQQEATQRQIAASQSRMVKQAIAEMEAAERAEAAELRRNQSIRDSFISSLQEQANAIGKTRTEILEMKAAQLGVSQQAAPFIAKLSEQERVFKSGTLTAGQYHQALRMLPAQFTDIATSIAGGMPLWMVLIQQGGQISDSFGGIGGLFQFIKEELLGIKSASDDSSESLSENANALAENAEHGRGLLSFLTPARVAIGGLVGVASLLAIAWYKGSQEATEFNKQLILTGDYAGKTTGQLRLLSKQIADDAGVTPGEAASTLAKVVSTGQFDGRKLEIVARTAAAMEDAVGQSVDETIKSFQKLYDSPTKASEELNKQLHYLTASQFDYLSALERRGDQEEAGEYAAELYSKAEQQRSQQVLDNLGLIDRVVRSVSDTWKGYWDAALGIGRKETTADQLEVVQKRIKELTDGSRPGVFGLGNIGDGGASSKELAALRQQEKELQFVIKSQEGYNQARAELNKINSDGIEAQGIVNKYLDAGTTAAEKRALAEKALEKAIQERNKAVKATQFLPENQRVKPFSEAELAKARAGIEKLYQDPKTPRAKGVTVAAGDRAEDAAQAELLALQAQLKTLQDHRSVNDTISQQRKDLYTTQSKFAVLEEAARTRQLSKQEQSLLASKDQVLALARQKALLGDQITAQEQLNKRMDTASKYVTQMAEKRAGLESGATMSDRLAGRQTALSQLRSGWINTGGSLEDEGYQKELKAANDYYEAEDKLRGDWRAGFKKGWSEYLDSATNVYASMQSVAQSTLGGISDMMTNLVTTGTASFKSFAASMMKMIADVINRLLVAYAVQSALGWVTGSVSSSGGSTPSGAYTSAANSGVSLYDSGGYTGPGGKYEPAGIVHKDEFVFTKEATAAIGVGNLYAMMHNARGYASGGLVGRAPMFGLGNNAGAGNTAPVIQTTVHVDANGNASAQSEGSGDTMGRALAAEMQNAATQIVQKHLKNGGLIYNFVKGR